MDRAISEVDIEHMVCVWATDNGWLAPKLQWLAQTGWPDRTFIKDGKVIFIEFKKPGGVVSKKQHHWIGRIRAQGIPVAVFDDPTEAIAFLQSHD